MPKRIHPHDPPAPLVLRPAALGTVVVTGAAGFIGSSLCEALLLAGWRVVGVDAFTESYDPAEKRANLAELVTHRAFQLVESDLALADLRSILEPADAVVHLAAESQQSQSWGGLFSRYVERNVLATQRLLEVAAEARVARFIYASSSSIYGSADAPSKESDIPQPASPYAVSKMAGEHLAAVHASNGMRVLVLRYFSVYGPRQRPDMAVRKFIDAAITGQPLTVYGDGKQVRDLTFVDDAVQATSAALTANLPSGTVLNVAGGARLSVNELAARICRLAGVRDLRILHKAERGGDVIRSMGSIAAASHALKWQPSVEIETGIARQIEWQVAQERARRKTAASTSVPRQAKARGSRLMIYTQDGLGIGHLRRASSVATEFLRRDPSGWVLTTSDSPLGTLLRDVPNHDYLKLPSIVKAGPGDWHPLSLPLDFAQLRQLRSRLILEAAMAFEPDVLLVDHMPHGAMGELIPTLDALRDGKARIVLGMRDIIDAPEVVEQRWQAEGAFEALGRYYDEVLIYGSRDVFDVCKEYHWPREIAKLVRYCGYICTPETPDDPKRLRARRLAGVPRGALITAMAGGGADAHELMSTLIDALPEVSAVKQCVLEIVTGPFMPDEQRLDLKRRAQSLPVRMRTMVRNPLARVAAADLVVGMAGYNTTMEILRLGTPALLVPRRGPSQEQRMRTRRFAERGWVSQLNPDELSAPRLAEAIVQALSARSRPLPVSKPDLGGLTRAVLRLHSRAAPGAATTPSVASVSLVGRPLRRTLSGR